MEKYIPYFISIVSLVITLSMYFHKRHDDKTAKKTADNTALETAHLTDSAAFRKELREEISTLRLEIKGLKKELKETENELDLTKSDLTELQDDFTILARERDDLKRKKDFLVERVRELELQVAILQHNSNG